MSGRARWSLAVLSAALACAAPARARPAPDWLVEASRDTAGARASDAPAVDLLRETTLEVGENGTLRRLERRALRLRTADGLPWAEDGVGYLAGSGRVVDARAWRLAAGGAVTEFGRAQLADRAVDPKSLYDEAREQVLDLRGESTPGDVVGWEWVVDEHSVFAKQVVVLQQELPVRRARVTLRLPAGWTAEAVTFHHEPLALQAAGSTWIWEAHDLADLRDEAACPPLEALAPRLGLSWSPTGEHVASGPVFRTWLDVGRWLTTLDGPPGGDATVHARALELTGGAATDLERLRRIAHFVQDQPYAAIEMGIDRGAGYQPRPAAQVLRQGYGDCKDKANLVRALLHEVGISAWLVSVAAGGRDEVDARWASPEQFNHCIVAVQAPWAAGTPAAVRDSALGPLLLFDPTDPTTPVGALPPRLAGGRALVEAGEASRLLLVPDRGADTNTLRREVRGTIAADGAVQATLTERSVGTAATAERRLRRLDTPEAYRHVIEAWVARSVNGARVSDIRVHDERDSSAFELTVTLEAPRYASRVGERLLTLRPALVSRRERVNLGEERRRVPVRLEPEAWEERAMLALPAGHAVDELPEPAVVETPFARYQTRCEVKGDTLTYTRRLTVERADIPVARFAEVRDFFLHVRALEQAPVVLRVPAGR